MHDAEDAGLCADQACARVGRLDILGRAMLTLELIEAAHRREGSPTAAPDDKRLKFTAQLGTHILISYPCHVPCHLSGL